MTTLDAVVDIYDYARVPLNKQQRARREGRYPYYGANGRVGTIDDYIFDGEFILIAEDGGHFDDPTRAVASKVTGRFWVNNHAHVVRPKAGVDAGYLAYALRTVDWMQHVNGSTRLKLTQASLREIPVPLAPTAEQVRLAKRLDDVLALAASAAKELAESGGLVTVYRSTLLSAAFSGALTKEWREEQGKGVWSDVQLSDIVSSFTYGSSAKSSRSGLIPVLRMGNIRDGSLDWTDLVYTSDHSEIAKYALQRGDVLFNRTNSAELVGKTALYDDHRPAIYAGYLIKVTPGPRIRSAFLAKLLNSPLAKAYFQSVRSDGVNQSNINATKLSEFKFSLPSIAEQDEILRRVDLAFAWSEQMRTHISKSEALLAHLKVGVVAKAFRGDMTASAETDEPATSLLVRLAAEDAEARAARLAEEGQFLVKRATGSRRVGESGMKRRGEVEQDYLRSGLVSLGGEASAADLWAFSEMSIEEFYKQLRDEVALGHVREAETKGILAATDAT